ncbi:MAG TPA: hypothetical protein VKR99_04075 [Candidatus Eremiobacteraceae bacterium]|nr:hypothetical protein [Candidatus Eremiobacteraceae bacterium]
MAAKSKKAAAWGAPAKGEPRWPATIAVVIALLLYMTLPERLTLGPLWLIPGLELALIIPLMIVAPRRYAGEPNWERLAAIAIIAIINAANFLSLVLLLKFLVMRGSRATGEQLLLGAVQIWVTNVIVFALWYWELDRGGPDERSSDVHRQPDFLFPQMVTPGCTVPAWSPSFFDYVYVSFTNATAFSPTDTMPLTPWAKALMAVQAFASLVTVALVAARAVNILGS